MSTTTPTASAVKVPEGCEDRFEAIRDHLEARYGEDVTDGDVMDALYDAYWTTAPTLDPERDPSQTELTDIDATAAEPEPEPEPDAPAPEGLDALVAGLTLHEPQRNGDADRVVGETETCDCGRPAGADGLCEYHRRQHAGEINGNHGGRL